jgi:hypothetical protein
VLWIIDQRPRYDLSTHFYKDSFKKFTDSSTNMTGMQLDFCRLLNGICHQLNIFFEGLTSVLSVHAQMGLKFLACLVQEKNKYEVLLASLKTPTKSKNYFESRIKYFCSCFPLLSLVNFF